MKRNPIWIPLFLVVLFFNCSGEQTVPPLASASEAANNSVAGHWPQWRGVNRDGLSEERDLLTQWPEQGLSVLWKTAGGDGFSSLAVSDGRVYTFVDREKTEWAVCLNADSGEELWKVRTAPTFEEPQGGDGARSTPTVDGSKVYFLGATGALLCLDKRTGETLWQRNILKDFNASNLHWGVSSSPLVEGDLLLVNVGGPSASVVAFDKTTGEVVWQAHDDVAGYASPLPITVEGVREIVFFCGKAILGLSPEDGTLHWRQEWLTTSEMNIATPIFSDPFLFVSSGRGTGSGLFRLSRQGNSVNAEVLWTKKLMQNHYNGCILVGDYLYGFDDSILKCMRLKDGEEMWADRSVGKGSLIAAQEHLFILGEQGDVAMAKATPEGYQELGRMKALDYKSWTPPALAGGRLYVRDQRQIACLDLRNVNPEGT